MNRHHATCIVVPQFFTFSYIRTVVVCTPPTGKRSGQSLVWGMRNNTHNFSQNAFTLVIRVGINECLTLGLPGGGYHPLAFFLCNIFDDSNRKIRLIVYVTILGIYYTRDVTRDVRHILAYVTSSWRCHVTYVMTSNVHDGGQNALFLPLIVNRDIFWCRCD